MAKSKSVTDTLNNYLQDPEEASAYLDAILARTIHETPNPFTSPFDRSGFREGAEYRLYFDRAAQVE